MVFLPVIVAAGCKETNTVQRVVRPTTNVELTTGLVGESDTCSAEEISLDTVQFTPLEIRRVELVRASRVRRAGTEFLEELNLVVDTQRRNEGNDQTASEEAVLTLVGAGRCSPFVQGGTGKVVERESKRTTTDLSSVSGAGHETVGLRHELGTSRDEVGPVTTAALVGVLETTSHVAVFLTPRQAHFGRVFLANGQGPSERTSIGIVGITTQVGPITSPGNGRRRPVRSRLALGEEGESVGVTTKLERITSARHGALTLGSLVAAIVDCISAKALFAELHTRNGIVEVGAGIDTVALGIVGASGKLDREDTTGNTVNVTALVCPVGRNNASGERDRPVGTVGSTETKHGHAVARTTHGCTITSAGHVAVGSGSWTILESDSIATSTLLRVLGTGVVEASTSAGVLTVGIGNIGATTGNVECAVIGQGTSTALVIVTTESGPAGWSGRGSGRGTACQYCSLLLGVYTHVALAEVVALALAVGATVVALALGETVGAMVVALALGTTVVALALGETVGATVVALALGEAVGDTVGATVVALAEGEGEGEGEG